MHFLYPNGIYIYIGAWVVTHAQSIAFRHLPPNFARTIYIYKRLTLSSQALLAIAGRYIYKRLTVVTGFVGIYIYKRLTLSSQALLAIAGRYIYI